MNSINRRVVFFTADLSDNSLGRTYCLWQLARALGWETLVVAAQGDHVWSPLAETEFARCCRVLGESEIETLSELRDADIFIAVKPLALSFGRGITASRRLKVPLLLDVDDPDLEASLSSDRPVRNLAKRILRRKSMAAFGSLKKASLAYPTIVSNPVLQKIYGGPIIPHIREDRGFGSEHLRTNPVVAFVGSNRGHKGLDLLRTAVERCQDLDYSLVVTDSAPADARPWEVWTGTTSMEEGLTIVAESDVVVLPSLDVTFARGQLPAKLVDAMLLGRAIAVSRIEPMPWALGDSGIQIAPGSVDSIEAALRKFSNPEVRNSLGELARERAMSLFLASASIGSFELAVSEAIRDFDPAENIRA